MLSVTLVLLAFLTCACTFLALIGLIMFHFYLISYRGGAAIISPRHCPTLSNLGSQPLSMAIAGSPAPLAKGHCSQFHWHPSNTHFLLLYDHMIPFVFICCSGVT